ncbi:MAG: cysteine hydrolase [Lachnospiraceae bacterium]|nr:cysteine hydrolase [Lachnospiraceae bacterium]
MRKLVVVVDMQNDFIDGALGTKEAVLIVPKVETYLKGIDADSVDVAFTRDTHYENYLETQEGKKLPVKHCIEGTPGWEICDLLMPYAKNCPIFDKPTFGSTDLMQFAEEQKYDEIELMGLCTDICVISNAMLLKAALPEAKVVVRKDCCAGVTPESHDNALQAMTICQIEIA